MSNGNPDATRILLRVGAPLVVLTGGRLDYGTQAWTDVESRKPVHGQR